MTEVAPGYSRPVQTREIGEDVERIIATACPGKVVAPWPPAPVMEPYWGPLRRVGVGHATDEVVRHEASSGGAISALLIHALASGLVDRVIHVAADPIEPTRNVMTCSTNARQVLEGAGSRYTASSPLTQINSVLSDGGKVAFVGKPCDVSALRRLALVDDRVDDHIPLAVSFFCGGMPSHAGVGRILSAMNVSSDELVAFRFRGRGWPGNTVATTRDGRTAELTYEESWGGYLAKEVQFRCKICPDAVGGAADIACADAWYGGESGYPQFVEQAGRSLIIARTETGEALIDGAVTSGALSMEPIDPSEIHLMQPSQARRKRLVRARAAALTATAQPTVNVTGVLVNEASRDAALGEVITNFAGAVRRVFLRRRRFSGRP
jgi:coenzyme F420 hydrogenase subunit beta